MRTFTPAEVEEHTNWTAQGLRDLRSKEHLKDETGRSGYTDLLSNFGELQPNGRWVYSLRDLVAFWVASALNGNHMDPFSTFLPGVFAVSYTNAPTVIAIVRGETGHVRYTVFLHRLVTTYGFNEIHTGGSAVVSVADLDELQNNPNPNNDRSFHRADIFDWKHFADTMPAALRALVLEA